MLKTRIITAAVIVLLLFYCVSFAPNRWFNQVFFTIFATMVGAEFIAMRWHTIDNKTNVAISHPPIAKEHVFIGLAYSLMIPAHIVGHRYIEAASGGAFPTVLLWIVMCTLLGSASFYRREIDLEVATQKLMNVLAGFLYVAIPALIMFRLSEFDMPGTPRGLALYFSLAVILLGDTGAYFVGRAFGKHLLIPKVSPKKTVEGAIGGLAASALTAVFFVLMFPMPLTIFEAIVVAIAGGIAGQIGDLAESALKRVANCKDSGALLPGHGGALDRVDALLFGVPICYAALLLANA